MSLDLYLEYENGRSPCMECKGKGYIDVIDEAFAMNITHNLRQMAMEAGVYQALWRPEECGITKASQMIPLLEKGLSRLIERAEDLKRFNPPNGWGSHANLVNFVEKCLEACRTNPEAKVRACR